MEIYDRWDPALHPLAQMAKNMEKGMVLAMSAWYDAETYSGGKPVGGTQTGMSWMDGNNLWGGHYEKAGPCQNVAWQRTVRDARDEPQPGERVPTVIAAPIGGQVTLGAEFVAVQKDRDQEWRELEDQVSLTLCLSFRSRKITLRNARYVNQSLNFFLGGIFA